MLLTIGDFKRRVHADMLALVGELQALTGRQGDEEAEAWRSSLPAVANMLSSPHFDPMHVFFGVDGHTSLEYQLPASNSWCDMILLGAKDDRPSALVLELKHWGTLGDKAGAIEGLVVRGGVPKQHPSSQVGGYTEYLRRFHSEVLEQDAAVSGCVVFTRSGDVREYVKAPNESLTNAYPVFSMNRDDLEKRFPDFASGILQKPNAQFATAFEKGTYRQDRGFVRQIGEQIQNPNTSPFVLLDNQQEAYLVCRAQVRRLVDDRDGSEQKRVVIVHGPPGSGKSVVAAKVWASLVTDELVREGNVVIVTTSASQNSNWVHLVEEAARLGGAAGIVKKATQYHPITTHQLGQLRTRLGREFCNDAVAWRENVRLVQQHVPARSGAADNDYLVSIVDEAHALINPEHVDGRGQFGFAPTLGPQAYHIIRSSRLTVFFMDRDQGYRDRENTKVEDIFGWAKELGATVEQVDLSGNQFRCAGSKEYVEWIESIRSNTAPQFAGRQATRWVHREAMPIAVNQRSILDGGAVYGARRGMVFELFDDPDQVETFLRQKLAANQSARLLASYWRDWTTVGVLQPHLLPAKNQDFQIAYKDRFGVEKIWSKPWNYVPENSGDYTLFVQGAAGSAMAADPLCEVGCPYAVRGFDYDWIGLLWGPDLVWRERKWAVNPQHVFETGVSRTLGRARGEGAAGGPATEDLLRGVWQAYRILLTRAMRGVAVWVEDAETRSYLQKALGR